jgi:hypothetical protein
MNNKRKMKKKKIKKSALRGGLESQGALRGRAGSQAHLGATGAAAAGTHAGASNLLASKLMFPGW